MKTRVDNSSAANRILNAVRKDLLGEEMVKCEMCGKEYEDEDEDGGQEDEKELCPACSKKAGNTTTGVPGVAADAASRAPGVVGNKGK